jgi:chromosome segregation ATPase
MGMNLDKHPILWDCYNVTQAIEACGASVELTAAVVKSGELGEAVEKLVDRIAALEAENARLTQDLVKAGQNYAWAMESANNCRKDASRNGDEANTLRTALTLAEQRLGKVKGCIEDLARLGPIDCPNCRHYDIKVRACLKEISEGEG